MVSSFWTCTRILFTKQGGEKYPNYLEILKGLSGTLPKNAVILLFDNELGNEKKPISKCITYLKLSKEKRENLETKNRVNIIDNLYILVTPLVKVMENYSEINFEGSSRY